MYFSEYMKVKVRIRWVFVALILASLAPLVFQLSVHGIAKQSTLSVDVDSSYATIQIIPAAGGTFGTSSDVGISINTDNYSGYRLSVKTSDSTNLVNGNNDVISSISSSVLDTDFASSSAYNNKWGYKPSQYITTNNGVNTTVMNTNYFLPAPSSTGDLIDVTSAANVQDNDYTLSFGARVDQTLPVGTYTGTYVIEIVANSIIYNVTYDDNTTGTVSSMPSPNPQALEIDGGTSTAESYAKLSSAVPTLDDMSFGGWCDVATTIDAETGDYLCSGHTYQAGDNYPIDQTSSANNITLYAIWINDPFPNVWTQMGACEFHGATNGNITGTECQDYTSYKYIDTGIPLYSTTNSTKDYEVHFTIDHYDPSENNSMADQQQTFVSDKLSPDVTSSPYDGKGPGIVVRRSGDSIQIRSTSGHASSDSNNSVEMAVPSSTTTDISVYRIDGVIYASINHGALQKIQNISTFDQQFGLNTWFGAYPGDDCTGNTTDGVCTNAIRYIEATLSNMYIKLGDFDKTVHTITFNANGGTPSTITYSVVDGDSLGELPTATRTNNVLMYWYSTSGGSNIATPETKPRGDVTYYAFWLKEVSQATISNSSMNLAVNGTETINVTNSAELEDYTFSSNDDSVATVNSTTGLVTGVAAGTTTITMTGTKSGTTKTIDVTVHDSMARVTFDSGQGSSVDSIDVEHGGTISELPISIRSGYTLEGWYTGANGTGTKLTTSLQINDDMEFIANWIVTTNVCRLADPNALHTEKCLRTGTNGCRTSGNYAYNADIEYGKTPDDLADPTVLEPGLAYTCDINANNEYDEETERFYLLSTDSNKAALVWYKNISDVSINYDAAYALLPDSSMWRNINLIAQAENKVTRYMKASEVTAACGGNVNGLKTKKCDYLMEKSNFANTNMIDGIWLEKINNTSSGGRRIHTTGLSLGNVNPNTGGSNNAPRPVIEIPLNMLEVYLPVPSSYTITFNPHNGSSTWDETVTAGDTLGNAYPSPDPTYTNHIFQGWYTAETNGTLVTSNTEPDSSTTYHAQWKGTVALATVASNSISVPVNDTATVTVSNAADLEGFTFSSSDTGVATIDSSTGVITPVDVGTTNISITGTTSQTSNQIVTVTVTQPVAQHTITFNPHNGGSTWNEIVNDGDDLSSVYPSPDPTYTDHIFQGWYTAASGGTLVTSSTVPDSSTTYHAQWLGTVALATFSSNSITVQEGNTATITVTNTSDIEGFTFSSLDSTVATVDSSTGVVTGVAPGSTSIRMTGTTSQTYVDIPVTVTAQPTYTIYFNPHNGQSNSSATIVAGSTIGNNNIPADPTNSDLEMIFMGWYTAASGGTLVDGSTTPSADGETYHAQYKKIVCKLETLDANLHTISNHTYGIIANANNTTQGAPGGGTAYNCDVDYDDTYSPVNERFYYLGTDNSGNSALVAWNSYYNSTWAAGTSSDTIFSYTNALNELPSNASGAWDNPGIVEQATGKAARFSTRAEIASACNKTLSQITVVGALDDCDYTMEHTAYDGSGRSALWLMEEDSTLYRIHSGSDNRHVSSAKSSNSSMVRPTIVVPYKLIEKYTSAPTPLDVTNAVIGNSDLTVMVGQTLTIQVTNSASLEAYTFSSDDSSIATVNSSTGVVTGVSAGTVDIIMTGTTSNLTKTIEVEVVSNPDIPVVFDVSNDATRGYQALSAQWAQSPVNITTFNKDTNTINNSTWGDTSELSELQYWTAIRNNFVSNECFIQTSTANNTASDAVKPLNALSAWTSGSVDCSKPSAYDTNTNSALTVRLNDAQGAVVAYANADSGVIHNMIPGQTYYWEKTSDSTVYGYVTAVSNGSSTGTRWVDMDVVRNVRDLGGLPVTYTDANNQTVTGTLAYGRLFRGEKMQSVNASVLTNLGITTEYNVGDEYQDDTHLTDYHLNNVIHYDFDYNSGDENNANSNYMKAWTAVTNIMTDITNTSTTKNVYIHCRVGADRTGTVAYLLEGLLGVPDEQRYEEYGLSNVSGLYDRTRYYKQKSSTNNLKFVYMMGYVQTTQDIIDWYMHGPNASMTLVQNFRAAMTVSAQSGQQQSPAPTEQSNNLSPMSLNMTPQSLNTSINNNSDEEVEETVSEGSSVKNSNSFDDYSEPLGVYEDNTEADSLSDTELAIAAAAVAASGAIVAAAFAKNNKNDDV